MLGDEQAPVERRQQACKQANWSAERELAKQVDEAGGEESKQVLGEGHRHQVLAEQADCACQEPGIDRRPADGQIETEPLHQIVRRQVIAAAVVKEENWGPKG